MRLPEAGLSAQAIYDAMEAYAAHDLPWREGNTFAYVYDAGREAEEVVKRAYMRFLSENALDPTVYPSLARFETELIAIAAEHLSGDADVVGNFTSGGTESVILAVKTARDRARALKPHVTRPELVIPVTAHACFQKACWYLDVTPVLVPVSGPSWRVDPAAVEAAITPNTVMIVGSAPQYAHGVIDPIEALGAIALRHDVLLHVDACVGGWMLPFFREAGAAVPAFDFAVPGVTSISMDFHKFAYAAKGASIILHRNKELRQHQIYTCATWTGYSVINPTVLSTKSGGPLAAAWAILHFLGRDGYLGFARRMRAATAAIVARLKATPGVVLLGEPDFALVAFAGDGFSVFPVADLMKARGWYVQPQLGYMGSEANIHLTVDQAKADRIEAFLDDLVACVAIARQAEAPAPDPALAGMLAGLAPDDLTPQAFGAILAAAGADGGLPSETAPINLMLDRMRPETAGKLMSLFFNEIYVRADRPAAGGG